MRNAYAGSKLTGIGQGYYANSATVLYNNKANPYPLAGAGARHRNKYAIAQGAGGLSAPKPGA